MYVPQPADLAEMLVAKNEGKPYDHEAYRQRVRSAVAEGVRQQMDCGVDIVNDGELGKSNFSRYTRERLSGFDERPPDPNYRPTSIFGRDAVEFPEYFNRVAAPPSATMRGYFSAPNRSSISATRPCRPTSTI